MSYCSQCGELMFELHDGTLQCTCGYTVMHPIEVQASPIRMAACLYCGKIQRMVALPEYSQILVFCNEECLMDEMNNRRLKYEFRST